MRISVQIVLGVSSLQNYQLAQVRWHELCSAGTTQIYYGTDTFALDSFPFKMFRQNHVPVCTGSDLTIPKRNKNIFVFS